MSAVTIIDYGTSNLLSVVRAFTHCGARVTVTRDPDKVAAASRLVLPGVGAFARSMEGVNKSGLADPVRKFVSSGKPFLGICVGMQMMLGSGEEFGYHDGLGIIPGTVKAIPRLNSDGIRHKIPHIGWAPLTAPETPAQWHGTILSSTTPDDAFYFVHSFTAWPGDDNDRIADADYNGCRIAAVVRHGNAYGCQFHPEKSGPAGLRVINSFLGL